MRKNVPQSTIAIPDEVLMNKIYLIRGQKVMLDRDLAELYDVETRALNLAVRRNEKRFPADFMFQMSREEMEEWKSQIVISNKEKMGFRKPPLVFTKQGVAMLSSALNSERAIMVNIRIIRVFTKMRELLTTQKEILQKLEMIERKDIEQDEKIMLIFEYLNQFEQAKQMEAGQKERTMIGFKTRKR
jgi:hypothetical protein